MCDNIIYAVVFNSMRLTSDVGKVINDEIPMACFSFVLDNF